MNSPCKGCPKRYPGCHDHCPEYQAVKKADLEMKQKIKAESKGMREMTKMYAERKAKRIKKYKDDVW